MNDIISIYSSILNQAIKTKKNTINIPFNKITLSISSLLYKENLIYSYNIDYLTKRIQIALVQIDGNFNFSKIIRISKPGKRIYWSLDILKSKVVKEGKFYIISTNNGIITSNEALKTNISGEILIEIFF